RRSLPPVFLPGDDETPRRRRYKPSARGNRDPRSTRRAPRESDVPPETQRVSKVHHDTKPWPRPIIECHQIASHQRSAYLEVFHVHCGGKTDSSQGRLMGSREPSG